jgi:hypothetical protein
MLVNVGVDPLKHHRDLNILMTTERTDSLSYAGVRENLVLTLDQVTLNSWNEVLVNRFDGPHALLDCLRDYLNNLPADPAAPVAGALLLPQPRAIHCPARRRNPRHRAEPAAQQAQSPLPDSGPAALPRAGAGTGPGQSRRLASLPRCSIT